MVGAPDARVYHAVAEFSLLKAITFNPRWQTARLGHKAATPEMGAGAPTVFWKSAT